MILLRAAAPNYRVPKGAIWPHNDTTPPDGTERFTAPDNRLIVGAGNLYAAGDTGGSNSVTLSGSTGTGGSHVGNPSGCFDHPQDEGSGIYSFNKYAGVSDGNHAHTYDSGTFVPAQRKIILVKSIRNLREFPANALLMSTVPQAITNNTDFNDKYFQGNSVIEDVAESSSISLGQAGGHDHGAGTGQTTDNVYFKPQIQGAGSHGGTITPDSITESIKKIRLSMWTRAADRIRVSGNFVIMWESPTPPPGWELFTDVEDCFVLPCASGSENTTAAGNNTIDMVLSGSITHEKTHNHGGSNQPAKAITSGCHTNYTWSHSHTVSTRSGVAYLPPYYALYFIKKS